MPKIPTYGGQQVNEAPLRAPMNPTEAPLEAFGGGQSAANAFGAAANIGQGIEQIAGQEYRKQYQDAVNQQSMEAANKLLAEQTRLKMSMADLSGPEAQKATGSMMGNYEKFYQSLEKDLQNSDVRKNVYGHYLNSQNQLNEWAQHNASVKMKEYDHNEFAAEGKTLQDSVSLDPSMPNVATAVAGRKLAIEQFASRNGYGPEWVKANQEHASSGFYLTALRALARGNDLAASRFYEENKGEFIGADADHAAQLVEATTYRGQAQRETERIYSTNIKDEQKALDEARKIEDPTLQDMVVTRIKGRFEDKKRIEADALRADVTEAANLIEGNPSLDAIPVELYQRLPIAQRRYLLDRINQIKKGLGPQPGSDEYLKYLRESAVNPDTFVKRNFAAMRDEITDHEATELTKEQASIIKGDGRMAKRNLGFLTLEQRGKLRLKTLGVTDEDDVEQFMSMLDHDYFAWRSNPKNEGAPLDPADAEDMISKLIGRERKLWQFSGEGTKPVLTFRKLDEIPMGDRVAIENQLRENGETPTIGRIIELWEKGQNK